MNWPDRAASAMLMPPEAEPVMPARVVTVTASLTSGFGIFFNASETAVVKSAIDDNIKNQILRDKAKTDLDGVVTLAGQAAD